MKSDLTCPVEVTGVHIREDSGTLLEISFANLGDKRVDSLQMNIICYNAEGERLGGRLLRSAARENGKKGHFSGLFRPERVEGTARVDAQVEKIWFADGVIWRREERNVREYESNRLNNGRELDRLRQVAGPDAQGYAREEDLLWLCVCGRANRNSDEKCMRCGRLRQDVLRDYSFEAVDATQGEKERLLQSRSQAAANRSSSETAKMVDQTREKELRTRRRMVRSVALVALVAIVLAGARFVLPRALVWAGDWKMEEGAAADARSLYLKVAAIWPDTYGAGRKAEDAERVIIERLISSKNEDSLAEAISRSREAGDAEREIRAVVTLASLQEKNRELDRAEKTLLDAPEDPEIQEMRRDISYQIALEAKEKTDYPQAISRLRELGEYQSAPEELQESLYLYGRQLMREGKYEEACARLTQVPEMSDALALVRQCRYAQAEQLEGQDRLVDAAQVFESLGLYEDAATRAASCRYRAGNALLLEGDLQQAARQLRMADTFEDAQSRFEDVALKLGMEALGKEDYQTAVEWLGQIRAEEAAEPLQKAVYGYAMTLAKEGHTEEAIVELRSLGGYEDAFRISQEMEYALALEEMKTNPEDAAARFDGLGDYEDSEKLARQCREAAAQALLSRGDYRAALERYLALGGSREIREQVTRCRYALAGECMQEKKYEEAVRMYRLCGAYLDSEERVQRCNYERALILKEEEKYQQAAAAFGMLGSYEDAPLQKKECEDRWMLSTYQAAQLDSQLGNYLDVIRGLEPVLGETLPARFSNIPQMYEEACIAQADQLISAGHPLDALPFLEKAGDSAQAKQRMEAYVYRILGRWKDPTGIEYIFRRDGSCSIDGTEGYFGGSHYEIYVGEEPYPSRAAYQVIGIRGDTLTLKSYATDRNIRLRYLDDGTKAQEAPEEPGVSFPEEMQQQTPEEQEEKAESGE